MFFTAFCGAEEQKTLILTMERAQTKPTEQTLWEEEDILIRKSDGGGSRMEEEEEDKLWRRRDNFRALETPPPLLPTHKSIRSR